MGPDPHTDAAERDRTPDAEAAAPYIEGGDGVVVASEVEVVVGDDVVQPPTDDPERDRPQGQVGDLAADAAAGLPAPLADPDRGQDARDDAQGVPADRHRPE